MALSLTEMLARKKAIAMENDVEKQAQMSDDLNRDMYAVNTSSGTK